MGEKPKRAQFFVSEPAGQQLPRSGDRIAIGSYLGKGETFDRAIAEFSERYADQNELDYGMLADAAKSGRIEVETDLN